MPAAMGAARVPRRRFKTAYTSKKTKTMSATLRGSIIRLKYSVYGSKSNISNRFSDQCSSVNPWLKSSTDMFRDRSMLVDLIIARGLEKYHLHFRLGALNPFFNLFDSFQNIVSNQILSKLHM